MGFYEELLDAIGKDRPDKFQEILMPIMQDRNNLEGRENDEKPPHNVLSCAVMKGRSEILRLILASKFDYAWFCDPLSAKTALKRKKFEVVKILVENGFDVRTLLDDHDIICSPAFGEILLSVNKPKPSRTHKRSKIQNFDLNLGEDTGALSSIASTLDEMREDPKAFVVRGGKLLVIDESGLINGQPFDLGWGGDKYHLKSMYDLIQRIMVETGQPSRIENGKWYFSIYDSHLHTCACLTCSLIHWFE